MSPTVLATYRVRTDECDPYGHLNNAVYLHYALDAARGSPAADSPRALVAEYFVPVAPGDVVDVVDAAVSSDADTRSLDLLVGERLVARVTCRLDGDDEPQAAVPEGAFTTTRMVEWRDVGPSGRTVPGAVASLAEDAGIRVCTAYGWPLDRCAAAGFGIVLRRHEIDVGVAPGFGVEVDVATWATDARGATAVRHYVLTAAGDVVARFRSLYVWVDLASGRPIRIPQPFLADFAGNFLP